MKTTTFLAFLLPFISISPALSATIPHAIPAATTPGDVVPNPTHHDTSAGDGLYRVTIDSDGNPHTEFTPYDRLFNLNSSSIETRSDTGSGWVGGGLGSRSDPDLEKRRDDCGPGSTNVGDADVANKCLVEAFAPGTVFLKKHAWTYCVRNEVVSFICPYSGGYKPRDNIEGTFYYVKQTCGPSTMGYAQVSGGQGDWTAGYARKSDNFCDKHFSVGN
ncbi:hypothetical protein QBC45DRAFT_339104 [Copromyces sp. CBS 386.78]|nr:hypothetical protein QBC45DRAFT_339104 [Copromyces sp. CBS 386.78]